MSTFAKKSMIYDEDRNFDCNYVQRKVDDYFSPRCIPVYIVYNPLSTSVVEYKAQIFI